eukprot:scaffold58549_cov22-Prasinocladus_malaysianus.AAC.1
MASGKIQHRIRAWASQHVDNPCPRAASSALLGIIRVRYLYLERLSAGLVLARMKAMIVADSQDSLDTVGFGP